MKKILLLVTTLSIITSTSAFAHSGRTDSNGGHTDKKTGKYHYHKKK